MDNQNNTIWWKNGYVWLILGGPFLVVIASFITYYLAVTRPDSVIDNYYQKGILLMVYHTVIGNIIIITVI